MKIKKFNENNDSDERTYYLFIDHDNFNGYYLFKEYKDACNWMINVIYDISKRNNALDDIEEYELDEDNLEDLVNYYQENIYENYNENKIEFERVYLSTDIQLLDWIAEMKNVKKYNI